MKDDERSIWSTLQNIAKVNGWLDEHIVWWEPVWIDGRWNGWAYTLHPLNNRRLIEPAANDASGPTA